MTKFGPTSTNIGPISAKLGAESSKFGQSSAKTGPQSERFGRFRLDTDVTKPLVAVRRIVDRGNEVHFTETGGWIGDKASGKAIQLAKKGGCYVLNVELLTEVGVDRPSMGFSWQA